MSICLSETLFDWFIENSDDRSKTDNYSLRMSDYQSGLKKVEPLLMLKFILHVPLNREDNIGAFNNCLAAEKRIKHVF